MKRVGKGLLLMLVMACMTLMIANVSYAAEYVNLKLDGTAEETSFENSAYWCFSTAVPGTVKMNVEGYVENARVELLRKAGASTYSLWLSDLGELRGGNETTSVKDSYEFHIDEKREYAVEIYAYGEGMKRAIVSATFVPDPMASEIRLDQSELTLYTEDHAKLQATVLPENAVNKELEWSCDNRSVLHVYDNGAIVAEEAGVATVFVQTKDGSVKASCHVVVLPDEVYQISADKEKTTLKKIRLTWDEIEGAAGYHLYKYDKKTKQYVLYRDTMENICEVKGLSPETAYKFMVAAYIVVDGQQREGKMSEKTTVWTAPKQLKTTKITSISVYKRVSLYNFINVKWKKVKGATGYTVYGKYQGRYQIMGSTKKTSMKLYAGRGYSYSIKVVPYRTKHGMTTKGKASKPKKYVSR